MGSDPSFLATPSWDVLSSAAYGTPTAAMYGQINAQGAADIAKASGGNSALAQQETQALTQNISSYSGISGGVAPSLATEFQSNTFLSQLVDPTSPVFWIVGGVAALALLGYLKA